jgi:hypothetical protein
VVGLRVLLNFVVKCFAAESRLKTFGELSILAQNENVVAH